MKNKTGLIAALALMIGGCNSESAPTPGPTMPTLPPGWSKIEPSGETVCARGTPYAFWVRPGTANKLLIYFQGGGACWDAETCRPGSGYFDDSVGDEDSPAEDSGIFDLANSDNPFREYHMLFVPYCTGDVHWGNNVKTYEVPGGAALTIHHKGFVNAGAALQWAYANLSAPESIFVTGCSAGSIGSILFAPYAIQRYAQSRMAQLGDSEAFVFDRSIDLDSEWNAHASFPQWIADLAQMKREDFTMARFYAAIADFYPDHTFAQYNTAHDAVQVSYYEAAGGNQRPWEAVLRASLAEIRSEAANFKSYLAPGDGHCITPFSSFYTLQVSGVRFRDWVQALADGKPVESVECAEC